LRQKQGSPGQEVKTKRLNCRRCNLLRYRRKALRQGHPRGLLALPSDGMFRGVGLTPWTHFLSCWDPGSLDTLLGLTVLFQASTSPRLTSSV